VSWRGVKILQVCGLSLLKVKQKRRKKPKNKTRLLASILELQYIFHKRPIRLKITKVCKIWGVHGGDYEECRLLEYKHPVRTSQESNQLMLYKIWGFTAVTMKNGVFCDVMPCGSCKDRRFGGI
jgi:hypothetical protein